MTVRAIVLEYLNAHDFDGLYYSGECACKKDELAPCIESHWDCQPGYLRPCPATCGEHDWHIGEMKE